MSNPAGPPGAAPGHAEPSTAQPWQAGSWPEFQAREQARNWVRWNAPELPAPTGASLSLVAARLQGRYSGPAARVAGWTRVLLLLAAVGLVVRGRPGAAVGAALGAVAALQAGELLTLARGLRTDRRLAATLGPGAVRPAPGGVADLLGRWTLVALLGGTVLLGALWCPATALAGRLDPLPAAAVWGAGWLSLGAAWLGVLRLATAPALALDDAGLGVDRRLRARQAWQAVQPVRDLTVAAAFGIALAPDPLRPLEVVAVLAAVGAAVLWIPASWIEGFSPERLRRR